jgi:hypothetical protein
VADAVPDPDINKPGAGPLDAAGLPAVTPQEAKIAREGNKEVADAFNFVHDPAEIAKIEGMTRILEKATPYPNLHYTVRIVTSKEKLPEADINAFSLPGGYVYFTKDLIDSVQSDDELAAVLGHEMAHVIHHHVLKQIQAMNHDQMMSWWALLAAALATRGSGEAMGDVALMGPQVVLALHSKHSIYDETQADLSSIDYLHATGVYNPVGMLTFIQRMELDERHHPEVELGYLQDHPSSKHRVQDIEAKLIALGIPLNERAVSQVLTALAVPTAPSGATTLELREGSDSTAPGIDICTFTSTISGQSPAARARSAATAINAGIDAHRVMAALQTRLTPDGLMITWEDQPLFVVSNGDAASANKTIQGLAQSAIERIQKALWDDQVARS